MRPISVVPPPAPRATGGVATQGDAAKAGAASASAHAFAALPRRRALSSPAARRGSTSAGIDRVPLFGAAFAERAAALPDSDADDALPAPRAARVVPVSLPARLDATRLDTASRLDRVAAAGPDAARDTEQVDHVLAQLVACVPPDRRGALRQALAPHRRSLHALAGDDAPARQAAAALLALDAPLCLLFGPAAAQTVVRDDVSALVEASQPSLLTDDQVAQIRAALAGMPPGPTPELWQRFATGRPELAGPGPSPAFRLAVLLHKAAGCEDDTLEERLHDIERRLAPSRSPLD